MILWKVTDTDNQFQQTGNFGSGTATLSLPDSNHVQKYTAVSGIDMNRNGTLDANEIKPKITVYTALPVSFSVQAQAFIKQNNVRFPEMSDEDVFQGDDRGGEGDAVFSRDASARITETFNLLPYLTFSESGSQGDPTFVAGTTNMYRADTSLDENGDLTAEAIADTVTGPTDTFEKVGIGHADTSQCTVTFVRKNGAKVEADFVIHSGNPLVALSDSAAPILANMQLTIDYTDPFNPKYSVTGSHSSFPCFQVYANSQRVDEYDSGDHSPADLTQSPTPIVPTSGNLTQP